jgi:TolA-binding protein
MRLPWIRAAAWIRGLFFVSINRYLDAGREFKIVAQAPEYTYTESASRWLAVCLFRCGKIADGNIAFDNWVRRYRPDAKLAGRVLELMEGGTL